MDLAFHKAGFQLVYANDMNHDACETFKENLPAVIANCPIENVDPSTLPDADIITGGFPCQDFSVIWKRPGLTGERGGLYGHFVRFVENKLPKVFVAENVKGLLSANKQKAIKQIIEDFEGIGPGYLIKPKLYNFADYGVPQFRERVILVGIRKDTGFNFIHPAPTHGPKANQPYITAGESLDGAEEVPYNNEHMKIMPRTVEILKRIPPGGNFSSIPKESEFYVKGMISHVYRRCHAEKPAATIIAAGGGGTWGYHHKEPRALTNRERARLQSFPDDFRFKGTFTEIRRQIGNAVPPVGIKPVADAIYKLFSGDHETIDLEALSIGLGNLSIKERLRASADEALSEGQGQYPGLF